LQLDLILVLDLCLKGYEYGGKTIHWATKKIEQIGRFYF